MLSKSIPVPRPTLLSLSDVREEKEKTRNELKEAIEARVKEEKGAARVNEENILYSFSTLHELEEKIRGCLPEQVQLAKQGMCVVLFAFTSDETPSLKYCVKIRPSLEFDLFHRGEKVNPDSIDVPGKLSSCSDINQLVSFLNSREESREEPKEPPDEDFISVITKGLVYFKPWGWGRAEK